MGGLSISIEVARPGLCFSIKGFTQSMKVIIQTIMQSLVNWQYSDKISGIFNDYWNKKQLELVNALYNQPYMQVGYQKAVILHLNDLFMIEDKIIQLQNITYPDLVWFSNKFLNRVRFEWLIMGNITAECALEVTDEAHNIFKAKPSISFMKQSEAKHIRYVQVPQSNTVESTLYY